MRPTTARCILMAAAMNRRWGRGSGWEGPEYRSQRRGRRRCHNRRLGLAWLVVALALSTSARPRASSSSPWPSHPASPFMRRSRSHVRHPVLVRDCGTPPGAIETTDHASVDFGDPWDGGRRIKKRVATGVGRSEQNGCTMALASTSPRSFTALTALVSLLSPTQATSGLPSRAGQGLAGYMCWVEE